MLPQTTDNQHRENLQSLLVEIGQLRQQLLAAAGETTQALTTEQPILPPKLQPVWISCVICLAWFLLNGKFCCSVLGWS